MDNVIAAMLGRAARASKPGGGSIDHGWSLLKELDALGFEVKPRPGSKPHSFMPWHAKGKTLNEVCRLNEGPPSEDP